MPIKLTKSNCCCVHTCTHVCVCVSMHAVVHFGGQRASGASALSCSGREACRQVLLPADLSHWPSYFFEQSYYVAMAGLELAIYALASTS